MLRLGVGTLLAMNVMTISLLLYTGSFEPATEPAWRWTMLALSTPTMLILGVPFVAGTLRELAQKRLRLDALIAIGSFSAFGVSAYDTFRGRGHVYFDTATMLLALVTFGKLLEAAAKTSAARLLQSLRELLPARALRMEAGTPCEIPSETIRPGDVLLVRPGERFAADGVIVEGSSRVEQAAFTGEFLPKTCAVGDEVLAGTINGEGALHVRTTRAGEDVLLHRILEQVEDARQRPARFERLADAAAGIFTPLVLLLAGATGTFWLLAGQGERAMLASLAVVVVACPCAMGIATSLATAMGIRRAATLGAVVRGGETLEKLGRLGKIYFDKTGTLTQGRLSVLDVQPFDTTATPREILAVLAGLESRSEHAIARAIVGEAGKAGIEIPGAFDVRACPGEGVRGRVIFDGVSREVLAGTAVFVGADASRDADADSTQVWVSWNGAVRGKILLGDSLRSDAAEAVERLKKLGIRTAVLSGDRLAPAKAVAKSAGIDEVFAPCLPGEKVRILKNAEVDSSHVGMVGDGINDAPALASCGVGFALGAGADIARQAGHVVLPGGNLEMIPALVELGRVSRRIISQNLCWALGYNGVALAAAAAGWLHPLLAAVAMAASSLTVLANSMRLGRFPPSRAAEA
jgi:heavy metal translocating P-type ATPase